jgi:enamine deaminase RidA (YjgF/YER057c/UK114 family)
MKTLLTTLCLTIAVLHGSWWSSESDDFQKGVTAHRDVPYMNAVWDARVPEGHAPARACGEVNTPLNMINQMSQILS